MILILDALREAGRPGAGDGRRREMRDEKSEEDGQAEGRSLYYDDDTTPAVATKTQSNPASASPSRSY